jgi:hypothetical protein
MELAVSTAAVLLAVSEVAPLGVAALLDAVSPDVVSREVVLAMAWVTTGSAAVASAT